SVADARSQLPVSDTVGAKFVFVAPRAAKVFVVGDFNDWDPTKTPMVRASNDGAWIATLPMRAGRHLYSFVVDGAWASDPSAPRAPDDGFGHSNSVKIVGRGAAL
ncbi:MAG TPA: isoamylase early set domain-containing protein, partial [Gemmatimonadaceae bacterium]|nr:isoamylase early set domain-containing protein [Gemmatimonadaceae bacterium]